MGLSTSEDTQCLQSVASASGSQESPPITYYGVYLPKDRSSDENGIGVFTDKTEALAEVRKNRGARFKSCKTFQEALSFSNQTADQLNKSCNVSSSCDGSPGPSSLLKTASQVEKGTAFRPPKAQDCIILRKAIENGDSEYVTKTVWSNPRYLISSGDTPSILQEGSRYNALHVSAKFKQPAMCRFLLDTIENTEFMKLMYSDDEAETTRQRTAFLVDLYLNMPDKGACETPLHFASKYGCLKIVEMLASHPKCDRTRKNKFGETPKEVACSRCPHSIELLRQIQDAFEDHYYIPVYSCENHSFQPFIGDPLSPSRSGCSPIVTSSSPLGASHVVRALAGPMSPKQANDMYKNWKTPPFLKCSTPSRSCPSQLGVKLSDMDKGLERIGRQLAEDNQLEWTECWPFLGEFCNLKKPEGLAKLETYLRNKYEAVVETNKNLSLSANDDDDEVLSGFMPSMEGSHWSCSDVDSPVGRLCGSFAKLHLHSSPELTAKARPIAKHSRPNLPPPTTPIRTTKNRDYSSSLHSQSPPPPPSPLQLATAQVLDRLCRDVARVIAHEIKEHALCDGNTSSRRDFFTRARPGLECLMRVVRDDGRRLPLGGIGSESSSVDSAGVHSNIATLVLTALVDEAGDGESGGFIRSWLTSDGLMLIASSDEEEDSSSEEDFSRWRGHVGTARNASDIKRTIKRHLDCVLSQVVRFASRTSAVGGAAAGHRPIDCSCDWNLETEQIRGSTGGVVKDVVEPRSPLVIRGRDRLADGARAPLLVKPKWGGGASSSSSTSRDAIERLSRDVSAPIKCGNGSNRSHSAAFVAFESGDDSSSVDSFFTPPSSFVSSASSSCGEVHTPDEGLAIFINGLLPTKCDVDVLRALENANIDPIAYPHITRWKYFVTSHTKEEIDSWPTPSSIRRNTARKQYANSNNQGSSPLLLGERRRTPQIDNEDNFDIRKIQAKLSASIFSCISTPPKNGAVASAP